MHLVRSEGAPRLSANRSLALLGEAIDVLCGKSLEADDAGVGEGGWPWTGVWHGRGAEGGSEEGIQVWGPT